MILSVGGRPSIGMDDLKPYFRSRPRNALDRIERPRLAAWFTDTRHASVRIVCAPLGSGKTCAVQQYADGQGGSTGYVRVPAGAGAAALRGVLARGGAFTEIVLDEIDRADPDGYRALVDDITDGLIDTRLILIGRSRRRLHGHALVARGLAVACDPALLAFDAEETAALATLMRVLSDGQDVNQLLHDTEGWALATQWLVRDAAEAGRTLSDAFARWREAEDFLTLHGMMFVIRDDPKGKDDKGAIRYMQSYPQVAHSAKYYSQMVAAGRELGLSPASRTRIKAGDPPGSSKKTPAEEMFG